MLAGGKQGQKRRPSDMHMQVPGYVVITIDKAWLLGQSNAEDVKPPGFDISDV